MAILRFCMIKGVYVHLSNILNVDGRICPFVMARAQPTASNPSKEFQSRRKWILRIAAAGFLPRELPIP